MIKVPYDFPMNHVFGIPRKFSKFDICLVELGWAISANGTDRKFTASPVCNKCGLENLVLFAHFLRGPNI